MAANSAPSQDDSRCGSRLALGGTARAFVRGFGPYPSKQGSSFPAALTLLAVGSRNNCPWLLFDDAAGFVVYGSDGRRIGKVIELVAGEEGRADSLAVRHKRILVWRRRTVPVAAVATIDIERQTMTLLVDSKSIERAHELRTEQIREGWVADRIAHYAEPSGLDADVPTVDADVARDGDKPVTAPSEDDLTSTSADVVRDATPGQHVLFAPTAAGYLLIERTGTPPLPAATVELSDPPGRFEVVKLAQSPLPDDRRLCAYLDRLD
jgi:hypothetical protein